MCQSSPLTLSFSLGRGQSISPLRLGERKVPGNLRLEIAKARPFGRLVEVHLGHSDRSPSLGLGDRFSSVIENGRDHPVARDVFVGAADQIDVPYRRHDFINPERVAAATRCLSSAGEFIIVRA